MSLFTVVQRILDKAGTAFIEPRREDGHGSSALKPSFVDTGLTTQTDALTRAELDSAPVVVDTGLTQPTTPADTQPVSGTVALDAPTLAALAAPDLQPVSDDYQTGQILADQTAVGIPGSVLTFTFSAPVQNIWVYAVNPLDLSDVGEVRVDPFGGTPSATVGIPIGLGGLTPIPATTSEVKVFAGNSIRVTVYGNRRA